MARSPRSSRKAVLHSSFSRISNALAMSRWYVFDLLSLEGKDLRKEPLNARRKLLAKLLEKAPENIRFSGELCGSKDELLRVAQEFGLEGLVAKRPSLTSAF